MKRKLAVLVAIALILPLGTAGTAQTVATGTISGVVRLDGQPVAGVEVWLGIDLNGPNAESRFACTGADGSFSFVGVPLNVTLSSATGHGVQLQGRCTNQEFLDLVSVPVRPLLTQYYRTDPGGPIASFVIAGNKADLNYDLMRVPDPEPTLTAVAVSALNTCYTDLDAAGATSQGQTYVTEVDLMEANSEIDSVTADLMRLFGANLSSIFASPACQGSFVDDDNSIFEIDIEWLSAQGVTKGCNADGTEFCPDDFVSRGQMAAFLARALNLSEAASSPFTDAVGSIFEADIARVAQVGISKGCNAEGTLFCPDDLVTRGQMAAFLSRALNLPDGAVNTFVDDDRSIFESDIAKIAAAGITQGCSADGTMFCPDDFVTRGQMAAFIHRALE